jgi:tetratricopeptide (TPR) repeat protein
VLLFVAVLAAAGAACRSRARRTTPSPRGRRARRGGEESATRVAAALEAADALVGPGASFPTRADLADWLGGLPEAVTSLDVVKVRRAWLYVAGKRGKDAVPLLDAALAKDPKNTLLRSYLGEAKRQTGDLAGAMEAWKAALEAGAPDDQVLPSVRRLVYDLHQEREKDPADALPRYATVAAPLLAMRPMADVEEALYDWLVYDALMARPDAARVARLRTEAARHIAVAVRGTIPEGDRTRVARKALEAGQFVAGLASVPDDVPTAFDLFAAAVRLGQVAGAEGHEVPEALTALAEAALKKAACPGGRDGAAPARDLRQPGRAPRARTGSRRRGD